MAKHISPHNRRRIGNRFLRFALLLLTQCGALAIEPTPSVSLAPRDGDKARASIDRILKLLPNAPDPGELMYSMAARYAGLGEKGEALVWLRKTSDLHEGFDPSDDDDFRALAVDPEFQRLVEEIHRARPPVHRSVVAFSVTEADLIPEGIAYDPSEKTFYLGSTYKRKIIKIAPDGHTADFKRPREDGLWEVLGMKVDGRRGLWVNSAAEYEGPTVKGSSAVLHFDLRSGKLIKKYVLEGKSQAHLFNDLVLNTQGDVFLTDSAAGTIYWISHERDALEELAPGLKFIYPNGIALSGDEQYLYVAHGNGGISLITLSSKKVRILPHPANFTLAGIDGLYWYKNSLIAIQNGFGTPRVSRFFLTPNGDRVEKGETIEYRNPTLDVPTTGTFAGDTFYYIGTSQTEKLDDEGKIKPGAELQPVLVMKTNL